MRQRFEEWAQRQGWDLTMLAALAEDVPPGVYAVPMVQGAWLAWQAAFEPRVFHEEHHASITPGDEVKP